MAALLTLDEAKLHCRIDHNDEDSLLGALIETATASISEYLNTETPVDSTAPAPVKSAALLLVAGLYANREDVSDRQLYTSETYYRLLQPYRSMTL